MDIKLSVTSRNTNGETSSRSYGNITPLYIASIGMQVLAPGGIAGEQLPYESGKTAFETFWSWADAVGRAISALSSDTYITSKVGATWDTGEELAD